MGSIWSDIAPETQQPGPRAAVPSQPPPLQDQALRGLPVQNRTAFLIRKLATQA